jgi:hypothetical protein
LFAEPDRAHAHSGFFTLRLDNTGTFSASLLQGNNTHPFSGHFDLAGLASVRAVSAGTNSWYVTMALDFSGGPDELTGTIGNTQWVADLRAHRAGFNSLTNPATRLAGKYTLIIPGSTNQDGSAPEGDGYGALTVNSGGSVILVGSLADGNSLSQTVPLSRNGDWPLYESRYAGLGSVWGWLAFDTNTPPAGISGTLSWIKPAVPGPLYPGGFTNLSIVQGSPYAAPTASIDPVIALTNGVVIFEGGNLGAPFTNLVTLAPPNSFINGSTNSFSLILTLPGGTFSGSVKVPGATKPNTFKGALLQDLDSGFGFFLDTNQSGHVYLRPEP